MATGTNKEMSVVKAMMKQLATSVTSQAATLATLSAKMNRGSSSSGKTIDKKKARPGLHMCAHCNREVYHKDGNCLELEVNKTRHYPGWKSVFAKEYYDLRCAGSVVGVQAWLHKLKLKLKPEVQLRNY